MKAEVYEMIYAENSIGIRVVDNRDVLIDKIISKTVNELIIPYNDAKFYYTYCDTTVKDAKENLKELINFAKEREKQYLEKTLDELSENEVLIYKSFRIKKYI